MSRPELPVAAHLSQEEIEERARVAHELMQGIREAVAEGRTALWKLAAHYYHFEQEKAWLALGYKKRTHWLADPEISTTFGTYYRLVQVYQTYAIRRKTPALEVLDISKADIVRPALESGAVTLEEAIADIQALGWRDLRQKYGYRPPEKPQETETDVQEPPVIEAPYEPEISAQKAGELDDTLRMWYETLAVLLRDEAHQDGVWALYEVIKAGLPADTIVKFDVSELGLDV